MVYHVYETGLYKYLTISLYQMVTNVGLSNLPSILSMWFAQLV